MSEEPAKRELTGANRDAKGRFGKGNNANPRGRAPLPPEFKDYAKQSPAKLWEIANDEDTPLKIKKDILMWMSEMWYGKSPQALDLGGELNMKPVVFEGEDEIPE